MTDKESDTVLVNLEQFYDSSEKDKWQEEFLNEESSSERFQDIVKIASGGMKDIYKVLDSKTNTYIALAKLRADKTNDYAEEFLREAYLTARLKHPNIISAFDIDHDEDCEPFFTMELKVGDSLEKILQEKYKENSEYINKYPLTKLLEIFLKVCDAVSYAHSEKIVHLDIKPDNIQVGQFGEVQLCDWGLGSEVENLKKIESENTLKGTPGYMAPEQIDLKLGLGFHTDIYSLGALLYSILTNDSPFKGGLDTVIKKTITGEVVFPAERFPEKSIPVSLDAVVRKAMAEKAEERYKSVKELQEEVSMFLNGYSTDAENAGFFKEAKLFYKRNKAVCLSSFLFIIFLILGTVLFMLRIHESKVETETALKKLTKTNADLELARMNEKKYFERQLSLSQDLLEVLNDDAEAKTRNPLFYHRPERHLDHALKSYQKYYEVTKKNATKRKIIKLYFIMQRFSEAASFVDDELEDIISLSQKYSAYQLTDEGVLSESEIIEFLKDINQNLSKELKKTLVERIIVYHLDKRNRYYPSPEVIIELIKSWNEDWDQSGFEYNKHNTYLKLSGEKLNILSGDNQESSKLSFLRLIRINYLELGACGFKDLKQLVDTSVNVLDLRESNVKSLKGINQIKNLNSLIINKGQTFTDKNKKLPITIQVDER